jgi:uncharacterized MAPEG superfamily protein
LAHVCILVAALLPIVCAGIAKAGMFSKSPSQGATTTAIPGPGCPGSQGYRARANAAQANSFEALAAVHRRRAGGAPDAGPAAAGGRLALAFMLRLVYIWAYVADRNLLRSTVWFARRGGQHVALLFSSRL